MSDSIKKYNELVSEGKIVSKYNVGIGTTSPSQKLTIRDDSTTVYSTGDAGTNTNDDPSKLTEEQKAQAYRLLTEYDEKVIKFAFNRLMFG